MDAELIRNQLNLGLMTTEILLSNVKLVDESSRNTGDYKDRRYLPFYYHLGKQLKSKRVYQIGAKLGLVGACFLQSCKTVEFWLAMDHDRDLTARIIISNLKLHTKYRDDPLPGTIAYMGLNDHMLEKEGPTNSESFDLGLLTDNFGEERYLRHLDFLWRHLSPEGLLVADYIAENNAFHDFCRVKNREPVIFNTRYGVGIIQR